MTIASQITEKSWPSIILPIISVGVTGIVTTGSTKGLRVKQNITFTDTFGNSQIFQIRKVLSDTAFLVGDPYKPIGTIVYPTAFDGGSAFVGEQQRNTIADGYVIRSVYEEEPVMALRTVMVDDLGNTYGSNNLFPISDTIATTALDTIIPLTIVPVELKVGANTLPNRKYIWMEGLTCNIKWGFSNTTQSFDIYKNQILCFPVGVSIWAKVTSGTGSISVGEGA